MTVFKRGAKWWYEFSFRGQRIRESAQTTSKTAATSIERERRRRLELSAGGVRRDKPLLFSARHGSGSQRARIGAINA